jgi:hypothetical protein
MNHLRVILLASVFAGAALPPTTAMACEGPTGARITGMTLRIAGGGTFKLPGAVQTFGCFSESAFYKPFDEGEDERSAPPVGPVPKNEAPEINDPRMHFPLQEIEMGQGNGYDGLESEYEGTYLETRLNYTEGVYANGEIKPTFRFSRANYLNPETGRLYECWDWNIDGWLKDVNPGQMVSARGSQGRFVTTQTFRGTVNVEGMYVYDPYYCWYGPDIGDTSDWDAIRNMVDYELGVGTAEMETTLELSE